MKRIAIVIAVLLAAADASAISRHNISGMTCAKVQALIQAEGAAILSYRSARNPGLPRYDRFVRDRSFCGVAEVTNRTSVPTTDQKSCPVKNCIQYSVSDSR